MRLLRASPEQVGHQVFAAEDGETAMHILRREHPDSVVLDLMLPDRDGQDVTAIGCRSRLSFAKTVKGISARPAMRMATEIYDADETACWTGDELEEGFHL